VLLQPGRRAAGAEPGKARGRPQLEASAQQRQLALSVSLHRGLKLHRAPKFASQTASSNKGRRSGSGPGKLVGRGLAVYWFLGQAPVSQSRVESSRRIMILG